MKSQVYKKIVTIMEKPGLAWTIFVVTLLLTFFAWKTSLENSQASLKNEFDIRTREVVRLIKERMLIYEQVLWGTVGLLNASTKVDRDEFKQYVDILDLEARWPGIQGIGFAVPVTPERVKTHIEEIRQQGFPDYVIRPEGVRDDYSAIVYLEPFDWRNRRAFGYDMYSNPIRQEAMIRARDEGVAATSGMITLVQETEKDTQRGFLTYIPVYDSQKPIDTIEQRRLAFKGWIYSPFRCNDLMKGILGEFESTMLDFKIYDRQNVAEENLLFSSSLGSHENSFAKIEGLEKNVSIVVQGRDWTISFLVKNSYFKNSQSQLPLAIAIGGLFVDLLLFYALYSIGYVKRKADILAEEMTETIRHRNEALEYSEAQLKEKNGELEQFAYRTSHDLKSPLSSISGLLKVLKNEIEDGEADQEELIDILNRCDQNAIRLSVLVDDILNLSRASLTEVEPEMVNIAELLSGIKQSSSHMVMGKTVEYVDKLEVSDMKTQRVRIQQIFENLISNAIKYSGEKPIIVLRSFLRKDGIVIEVTDNGLGIPEDEHGRVFNMFHRAHPDIAFGSGLGLHLVKKHVQALGGTITFASVPGETTFTVRLPHD